MSEAELLTVRTKEGTTYKVNKALFVKMSPKIATAVQEAEEDEMDEIPLAMIGDSEFQKIVVFVNSSADNEPFLKIDRPLKSADLTESGVPTWAAEFINGIDLGDEILDLIEAASFLGIKQLEYLGAARISAEILAVGVDKLMEMYAVKAMKPDEERELKIKNPWAWREPDTAIEFHSAGEAEAKEADEGAGAGAGAGK